MKKSSLTEHQREMERKARTHMKTYFMLNRLMDTELPKNITRHTTPSGDFYTVHIFDEYNCDFEVVFDHHNNVLSFVSIRDLHAPRMEDIAREYLLEILRSKGTWAVATHKFGDQAEEIILAARKLLEKP